MEFNILVPSQSSPGGGAVLPDPLMSITALWGAVASSMSGCDVSRHWNRVSVTQLDHLHVCSRPRKDHSPGSHWPSMRNYTEQILGDGTTPQPGIKPNWSNRAPQNHSPQADLGEKNRLFQAKIWGRCVCYTAWLQAYLTDTDGKTKVSALPLPFRKLSPKRQPTLDGESSVTVCHSSPCP